jgi:phage gpG-like protein
VSFNFSQFKLVTAMVLAARAAAVPGVQKRMQDIVIKLTRAVKQDKLTGQVLHVRTGTLRRSITPRVTAAEGVVTGTVTTNVRYGILWEFGGTIPAYARLVSVAWGRPVRVPKMATWQARVVQPRSFIRSAVDDMMPTIRRSLGRDMMAEMFSARQA